MSLTVKDSRSGSGTDTHTSLEPQEPSRSFIGRNVGGSGNGDGAAGEGLLEPPVFFIVKLMWPRGLT